MNLLRLKNNVSALNSKEAVYGVLFDVIKSFESYLIDLNLIQLEKGINTRGQVIGTYSRATELQALFGEGPRPIEEKKEGDPYNFQWTGGLFDGFRLEIENDVATFYSSDSKAPLLKQKYGDIFGLTEENFEEAVNTKIYPAFAKAFRERLFV